MSECIKIGLRRTDVKYVGLRIGGAQTPGAATASYDIATGNLTINNISNIVIQ